MHPAYDEVIEGGDRIGLRPQADLARAIAGVPMVQEKRPVEIRLDVITHRYHSYRMPLAQSRRLHARCGQLVSPAVVVIQPKVVLQSVGPHDIVVPLGEAKDDTAGGVSPPRHR